MTQPRRAKPQKEMGWAAKRAKWDTKHLLKSVKRETKKELRQAP